MKYREDEILEIVRKFIEESYNKHYSRSDKQTQTLDLIMEMPNGIGFISGNIIKYISRFGKKRDNPREDLLKLIHYSILLYYFEFMNKEGNSTSDIPISMQPHPNIMLCNEELSEDLPSQAEEIEQAEFDKKNHWVVAFDEYSNQWIYKLNNKQYSEKEIKYYQQFHKWQER